MTLTLVDGAQEIYFIFDGYTLLLKLMLGVRSKNGLEVISNASDL